MTLAGVFIAARYAQEGIVINILQKPMDSNGRPLNTDASDGRFLVRTGQFSDIAIYHPGRLITVIGEVSGNEISYRYPVLNEKFLHLWRPSSGPLFFFGACASGHI